MTAGVIVAVVAGMIATNTFGVAVATVATIVESASKGERRQVAGMIAAAMIAAMIGAVVVMAAMIEARHVAMIAGMIAAAILGITKAIAIPIPTMIFRFSQSGI
jgi:hypothetical protein